MFMIRYTQYTFTLVLVLCIGCTCATDNNTPKEIDPTTKASIRVFNFSLGSGVLQLIQNDRKAIEAIPYGATSSAYTSMPSGIRNLRIINSVNNAVFSINADLTPNFNNTLYVIDTVTTMSGILLKDIPPVIPNGQCAVRIIHGGMHAGNTELFLGDTSGSPIIPNVSFRAFSQYVLVPVGTALNLRVNTDKGSVLFPIAPTALIGGSGYDIVLYGSASDNTTPLATAIIR